MAAGALLGSAIIGGIASYSSARSQANAAQAQNEETMAFNRVEAEKARNWQAAQSAIDRQFNKQESSSARAFQQQMYNQGLQYEHDEAILARNFNASEAAKARTFNASEAAKARAFNAAEAQKARDYSTLMANSAHQRERADLLAAGLNPILAANNGAAFGGNIIASGPAASGPAASGPSAAGLGTPSGAQASHNGSSSGAVASIGMLNRVYKGNLLGDLVHSAMDGVRLENDIKRAQAEKLNADANWKNAQTGENRQIQDAKESDARILNLNKDSDLKEWQSMSEASRYRLIDEQIKSEVMNQTNQKRLTEAQIYHLGAVAAAALTTANANAAYLANKADLESAKSPAEIAYLKAQRDEIEKRLNNARDKLENAYYSAPEGKFRLGVEKGLETLGKLTGGTGIRVLFGKGK